MPLSCSLQNYNPNWWIPYVLNGKTYNVLRAEALFDDFYRYKIPLMEWDKKTIYYCGVEGSGKTNAMRFSTWVLNKIDTYVNEGLISVLTNDIRILGDKRYSYLWKDNVFINLLIDDAMGAVGTDSVDYMNKAGRSVSKEFVTSRHISEEEISNVGVVFMSFATQHFTRLTPVIRDNTTLKIFTSYLDNDIFKSFFPYSETELIREMHHQAHVSTDWRKRSHAICRTGAAGIVHLEFPFVPKNQKELDFCRNKRYYDHKKKQFVRYLQEGEYIDEIIQKIEITSEKDFKKQKSHYNKIYVIDRSIDQDTIITRMSDYLRTQKDINYLIKHHPKRNSLEDFSRGKLYGFLREEANRITQEFCTDITKSDMLTAIEHALKEEDLDLVRAMKGGKVTFDDDKNVATDSNIAIIKVCMKSTKKKRIFHTSEISERTDLSISQIAPVLSTNNKLFENTIPNKGYWHLIERPPSEEQIHNLKQKLGLLEKPMKKLKMSGI